MMKRLCPRRLGSLVQANARRLSLFLSLALLILCAAINSSKLDLELSSWIQRTTRVESELKAIELAIGDGAGSNSLLILQTLKQKQTDRQQTERTTSSSSNNNKLHFHDERLTNKNEEGKNNNNYNNEILSVESMMIHLEALAIATHVTIDLYDVSWSLKDLCLATTPPNYEGLIVNQVLDNLMPCVIKTPLDCFWEGAKLLGPEQDVRFSSLGPKLKWTTLNPALMIELHQRASPHASFPFQTLLDWMRRVGISNGYLNRPCLDPSDTNCPASAPNKLSGEPPNVGHLLTGGCRGLATKQMHWKEEELVGGAQKNATGSIVGAEALQSTILLMGERDVYDYWRKTMKVQDVNNWSIDKAKLVLDSWQRRFKEELAQFTRSSMPSNSFKIHALTPKSMLEPIDDETVLDLTNFKLAAISMTLFTCIVFLNFETANRMNEKDMELGESEKPKSNNKLTNRINRFKLILLALSISTVVITTFIASLGLSSFINLPFNMATTQILPPLAFFYGFRQALMIANTFSQHYEQHVPIDELTTECLMELMPIIVMECTTFIIPLIVATAFPVQATRVFALQAIAYIVLSTIMAVLFVPSLLTIFLARDDQDDDQHHHNHQETREQSLEVKYSDRSNNSRLGSVSPGKISIMRGGQSFKEKPKSPSVDEQIFSRLQDDLKNIKHDPGRATDFNFSARFGPDGFKTSFSLRTGADHKTECQSNRLNELKTPEPSCGLPDLLLRPDFLERDGLVKPYDINLVEEQKDDDEDICEENTNNPPPYNKLTRFIAENRIFLILIVLLKIVMLATILMSQAPKIKFGLQVRDLLLKGTDDYESFMIREKYFPVYNIFAITRGGLDYPSKQKLLYEFHERMNNVKGVLRDENGVERKFWLAHFRDWLLELQENFDQERNKSLISKDGWTDEASDSAKLAYKLLVQTGKSDNPIDKNLIETNKLVDRNGIINQKAFYYYLTAWVMNDASTYSSSEADFRPQPKTWADNPNDLRIERARPPNYAQIPYLLKLPEDQDNMRTILEIRTISQRFELLDLPNFPTGIPFIFWDQFINLDYLFYTAVLMITAVLFLLVGLAFTNFVVAGTLILPMMATLFEIHGILGYLSLPFNSIIGVMLIAVVGIITAHQIQIITCFEFTEGDLRHRVSESIGRSFRTVIISLVLLSATALVFYNSKIDFMTRYSHILIYIILASAFNSLFVTPALLALFGSNQQAMEQPMRSPSRSPIRSPKLIMKTIREKKMRKQSRKKGGFPRVQSEISLSTISEEPQSEAQAHDLKLNFSIRC